MRRALPLLFAAAVLAAAVPSPAQDPAQPTMKVNPEVILMNTFYGGARVRVEGTVPEGADVVLAVRGPSIEEKFNLKGRFGPIWANAGNVHIGGVPSLFFVFTGKPLATILSRASLDEHQLDGQAIEAQMTVDPPALDQPLVRQNYIKLKANQGILKVVDGAVTVAPAGTARNFSADIAWPKVAPPAEYTLTVFACRDGAVIGKASLPLKVERVGFPQKLAAMAQNKAVLYGILCVLVATMAGLGIDFIASRLGGRVSAH